jgi:hypothetical protein
MNILCGWCPRPEKEDPNQSHGVCKEHAQDLIDQSDARHWNDVPSYIGNRRQFEQYRKGKESRKCK